MAFRQFSTRRSDVDIDMRLAVLTDAWNYFPIRCAAVSVPPNWLNKCCTPPLGSLPDWLGPCLVCRCGSPAAWDLELISQEKQDRDNHNRAKDADQR